MNKFAKLFEETECGQVLVKIDSNDDGKPEIRFYAQPEGFGPCSVAISFTDDDGGWDRAEAAFTKIDEAFAVKQVEPLFKAIAGMSA